ncbi:hypothetical protein PDESU_06440 [Pontiella desulfatans]|uniref:Uncharacterized protein n=1 Tax=Pontiella desulfatans TaxID=2750659 RepID=A0A6C2UCC0_PONDE|nr:hypothetical protein [Pontiella desulfatans]VGO17838.1 hypothetical protein PDESU_06440 [Pontiella desulfatans]
MKVELAKDKDGYTAKIAGYKHLVAFGYTKLEALDELTGVVELELDSQKEISQIEKKIAEYVRKLEQDD